MCDARDRKMVRALRLGLFARGILAGRHAKRATGATKKNSGAGRATVDATKLHLHFAVGF
jgi:hypothetical protein